MPVNESVNITINIRNATQAVRQVAGVGGVSKELQSTLKGLEREMYSVGLAMRSQLQSGADRAERQFKRISREASRTSKSVGNLQNNAFQFAQAIEDFQFAGLRGAANNINFLINSMAGSLGPAGAVVTVLSSLGLTALTATGALDGLGASIQKAFTGLETTKADLEQVVSSLIQLEEVNLRLDVTNENLDARLESAIQRRDLLAETVTLGDDVANIFRVIKNLESYTPIGFATNVISGREFNVEMEETERLQREQLAGAGAYVKVLQEQVNKRELLNQTIEAGTASGSSVVIEETKEEKAARLKAERDAIKAAKDLERTREQLAKQLSDYRIQLIRDDETRAVEELAQSFESALSNARLLDDDDAIARLLNTKEALTSQLSESFRKQNEDLFDSITATLQAEADKTFEADIKLETKEAEANMKNFVAVVVSGLQETQRQAEETAREAEKAYNYWFRQSIEAATAVSDAIEDGLNRTREFSQNDIELTRLEFDQQENDLRESLNNREIEYREYNLRMNAIDEERNRFHKEVQQDQLNTATQATLALLDVVKNAAREQILTRVAEFMAKQLSLINVPPPFSFAVAAGVFAAAAGFRKTILNNAGFFKGGYTGNMPTSAEAGVVHGQEYVISAKATRGNRKALDQLHKSLTSGANLEAMLDQQYVMNVIAGTGQMSVSQDGQLVKEVAGLKGELRNMQIQNDLLISDNRKTLKELSAMKKLLPAVPVTGRAARNIEKAAKGRTNRRFTK